ncbi:MAG TPA: alpha-amylase domain-containing protein [Chitinophagaceae bacterium]
MNFIATSKRSLRFLLVCLFTTTLFWGCSKNSGGGTPTPPPVVITPPPSAESTPPSQDVMLQAFYWDVTPIGGWWDLLNTKLDLWKSAGITALWLPVISKGQSGGFSMGYDPYDYFDFGQYNQKGTTETRFGSYTELTSLLTNAKAKGFKLIADIVINHNSGGDPELSPYSGKSDYTKFTPLSGKFNRNYEDFHPSAIDASDEGVFGGFPDLCMNVSDVKDWLYKRADGIGKFYKNTLGFDGWRFDYVKGYSPDVVKAWNTEVGGTYSIGEFYDGNVTLVNNWVTASGSGAFDFPLVFALKDALNGSNLTKLDNAGLIAINPSKAYTFVTNHDLDRDPNHTYQQNRLKAYAFILTAEGTPFIFYKDYEALDQSKLNTLISIHKTLAAGTTTKLFSSASEFIFRRNGTPGLITYINIGGSDATHTVQTVWASTVLKDFTGANADITTDASGMATITCKVNSYAVYSKK